MPLECVDAAETRLPDLAVRRLESAVFSVGSPRPARLATLARSPQRATVPCVTRAGRHSDVLGPPLLLLLLPTKLGAFALRERAEELLAAPGAVAVEPPRVSYGALGVLPPALAFHVARRQAKRMRLPGTPAAIAVFDPHQVPLGVALTQRHIEAELWELGPEPTEGLDSEFVLDLGAATDLRGVWKRVEALGIESGRLGSEREL